jgi:hypothetical protein
MKDTSITTIIERLREKGATHVYRMMGDEVYIEKSTLNLAASYLDDFLLILESLEEEL